MKPTLELQEIVSALGIDPFRFLAWQEKELAYTELTDFSEDEEQRDVLAV
ncbi:hypothetical protein [Paenibacillus pectinilyticus]|nr:hypothetical protein [Paenibacillus pectinilyticus]